MWCVFFFFFKQKTAYEMRISDWSSDVCSSDLIPSGQPSIDLADREGHARIGSNERADADEGRPRRFGPKRIRSFRRGEEHDCDFLKLVDDFGVIGSPDMRQGIVPCRPPFRDRKSTRLNSSH